MIDYSKYTKKDWKKLDGYDWCWLLINRPQYSKHCYWNKINGWCWRCLLINQPQFVEHCDWEKLDGDDWHRLLKKQPQFKRYKKLIELKIG